MYVDVAVPAKGATVSLPAETMQCTVHDLVIRELACVDLPLTINPHGTTLLAAAGFPTGLYLQVGGTLVDAVM